MSRLPKIVGIFIYFFVLITSFYHVFKFYEIFESDSETFVAFFVAVGFELSVLYFAYIHTKFRLKISAVALSLSLFIVWFGNVFVMAGNVFTRTFTITFFNDDIIKLLLAGIGSIFLPIGSFFMGKILAKLDILREEKKAEASAPKVETIQEINAEIDTLEDLPLEEVEEEEAPSLVVNIETVNEEMNTIKLNIESAIEEKGTIPSNIETANEDKEVLGSHIETVLEEKGALTSNIETSLEKKDLILANIETVNEDVETIPSSIETANEDIEVLPSSIETANEDITALPSEIGAVNAPEIAQDAPVGGKPLWEDIKVAVDKSRLLKN